MRTLEQFLADLTDKDSDLLSIMGSSATTFCNGMAHTCHELHEPTWEQGWKEKTELIRELIIILQELHTPTIPPF